MQPVSVAFFWHQHQPYYPDDVAGEVLMPWVRLHGTKDYYGMALHLKEVPEFHCTINLVPSLLVQLQRYTAHGGSDRHLDVSRVPADGLNEADLNYLLDNFFMASVDSMIRPYDRYFELYLRRGFGIDGVEQAAVAPAGRMGDPLEGGEHRLERGTQVLLDDRADRVEGGGRHAIAQHSKLVDDLARE